MKPIACVGGGVEEKHTKWRLMSKVPTRHIYSSSRLRKNSLADKTPFSQTAYSWTQVPGSQLGEAILQGTKPGTQSSFSLCFPSSSKEVFETDVDARRTTSICKKNGKREAGGQVAQLVTLLDCSRMA